MVQYRCIWYVLYQLYGIQHVFRNRAEAIAATIYLLCFFLFSTTLRRLFRSCQIKDHDIILLVVSAINPVDIMIDIPVHLSR